MADRFFGNLFQSSFPLLPFSIIVFYLRKFFSFLQVSRSLCSLGFLLALYSSRSFPFSLFSLRISLSPFASHTLSLPPPSLLLSFHPFLSTPSIFSPITTSGVTSFHPLPFLLFLPPSGCHKSGLDHRGRQCGPASGYGRVKLEEVLCFRFAERKDTQRQFG